MRSKTVLPLLFIFNISLSLASDSISFINEKSKRTITLQKDFLIYDALKAQQESKKVTECERRAFYQELKKFVKYPDKTCGDQARILVELEGIKKSISNCGVRLPRYEETLVKILNCGK